MAAESSTECINKRNQIKADINKTYNICTKQLTSTKVGHEFIQPINLKKEVLTLKFPEQPKDQAVILKEAALSSTYNDSFHWHYNDNDPIDRANSLPGLGFQYIKPYAEQIKVKPPKPHIFPFSEYQDKYPAHQVFPPRSKVINLRPNYVCEIKNSNKKMQPPLRPEDEGFLKHLDIYTSTSHFDHHPFNKHEVDQYKDKKFDVQKSISTRVKPVYDVRVFTKKYHEKILPKVSRTVPHSGMESEMKGNYRLPVNDMSTFRPLIPIEMPPIISATKAEILATPAMYHTEYDHLGNNWELSALLNNKPIKS